MIERLNEKIRRRTKVVGIFPSREAYIRLVTTYMIEYTEDWIIEKAYFPKHHVVEMESVFEKHQQRLAA